MAAPQLTNHIGFVIDRSGSMRSIRKQVIKVFNQQLARIKDNSDTHGQHSYVTELTFHSSVDKPRYYAKPAAKVPAWTEKDFRLGGTTALWDGVGTCVELLLKTKEAKNKDASYLVVVLTDGHENASRKYSAKKLKGLLGKVQKTGRWSLAFLVPQSGVSTLKHFGIPAGNIQPWQNNSAGTKAVGSLLTKSLDGYFQARKSGQKSVKTFFTTDLSKVDTKKLAKNLQDLSKGFFVWPIDKEVGIKEFVNKKLKASPALQKKGGKEYQTGNGFYELTKPEDVQDYKEVALMDKATKHIYGGADARHLLGFPDSGVARVTPGNHMNYAIFVESTSVNRKLVRGTRLLYKHP